MNGRPITSPQNQRIKDAVKLRDRRQRQKQGRIILDGVREIQRAISAGVEVLEAFVCDSLCESQESRRVVEHLSRSKTSVYQVTPELLEKVSFGSRSEGIVVIAAPPRLGLEEVKLTDQMLVAVVEDVEKPGNLGAVVRSADAAGVSAVIATGGGTDLYNPNCIRASLGTIFSLPVCAVPTAAALAWLRLHDFHIFAARPDAGQLYTAADYRGRAAFVLGSEAEGLTSEWHADEVTPIKLPMLGVADSLNVSATAAVLFYEALRQRSS
jgi:TrmH family RNA methyltransferase